MDLSPYYCEIHPAPLPSIPVEGVRELSAWEYCLAREDVDHYLGVRLDMPHTVVGEDGAHSTQGVQHKYVTLLRHGAVKPGPPRLTDFDITGSMKVQYLGCKLFVQCILKLVASYVYLRNNSQYIFTDYYLGGHDGGGRDPLHRGLRGSHRVLVDAHLARGQAHPSHRAYAHSLHPQHTYHRQ